VGAVSGFLVIYVLPVMVHLKRMRLQIENPLLSEALDQNAVLTSKTMFKDGVPQSPKIVLKEEFL
jgi:hypothetical protein